MSVYCCMCDTVFPEDMNLVKILLDPYTQRPQKLKPNQYIPEGWEVFDGCPNCMTNEYLMDDE